MLAQIARHGRVTAREISLELGITERSVHRIISDLEAAGYLKKGKVGRSNVYSVNRLLPLRTSSHGDVIIGDLLEVLLSGDKQRSANF